jgi:predicted DNA-binding protein
MPNGMVMRSIYLPLEMDERLRTISFVTRRSKADLIRQFVDDGMMNLASRLRRVREEDFERAARESGSGEAVSRAKEEREAFERDIERLQEYINRHPRFVEAVSGANIEHR